MDSGKYYEYCLKCGFKCCREIGIWTDVVYPECLEFYKVRGFQVDEVEGRVMIGITSLEGKHNVDCPHLTPTGCGIYKDRPSICREYDGRKDPLMKDRCLWPQSL